MAKALVNGVEVRVYGFRQIGKNGLLTVVDCWIPSLQIRTDVLASDILIEREEN